MIQDYSDDERNMQDKRNGIVDTRIIDYKPLKTPFQIRRELPQSSKTKETVINGRRTIENILDGKDDRIMIIAGPCSIHDIEEAKEYARKLKGLAEKTKDKFFFVMRTYFEKPRTINGWKGFLYDPHLNNSNDINEGLYLSRELLLYNAKIGLHSGTEYLESFTPQYNSDLVSWVAIGARTVESPQHRQMASGLSIPVGFKNTTRGDVKAAINAVLSARESHAFLGIDELGIPCIIHTSGNPYGHIILRGGKRPNYSEKDVKDAQSLLREAGLPEKLIIDCSHGNSNKDYKTQIKVFEEVIRQIKKGNKGIVGIMLESNLREGKQEIPQNLEGFDSKKLEYGISITDSCISFDTTEDIIMKAYDLLK